MAISYGAKIGRYFLLLGHQTAPLLDIQNSQLLISRLLALYF